MDQSGLFSTGKASARVLAAVFLLSASGLIFEITLTRVFSATIWYHYTFVAISVAMFGWGLGGFLVYILQLARQERHLRSILIILSLLFALVLPLFPFSILQFPFTPARLNFYFAMGLLPFMAGGAALSLAFEAWGKDSNRLYFADLVGAALGALIVPLIISEFGALSAILATAVLPAMAAMLLCMGPKGNRRSGWLWVVGLVLVATTCLTGWNCKTQSFTIRDAPEKGLYKLMRASPDTIMDSDRWNVYSRVTSVSNFDDFHLARLYVDSDAWTNVIRWDGRVDGIEDSDKWFRSFPFRLVEGSRVLVIGPGGGTDVVLAVCSGSESVTAVEMNPLIVDCVRRLGDEAGNLYDHPKVKLVIDEGRNFVERTGERYDLIVLGFVDSWASVTSGGLSLTENYLYTREAMEAYYDHLTEAGALVVIRWPIDVPRLVSNSVDLLGDRGLEIGQIGQRLLAVSEAEGQGTEPVQTVFMLSRSPLSETTVDKLLAGHDSGHVIYAPSKESDSPYGDLFAGRITFEEFTQGFDSLATPVDDDRPFYFATEKPYGIPGFMVRLLRIPVAAVVLFSVLLLVGGRLLSFRKPSGRMVAYFGGLGGGFIICEVALIQRLILLLGHPIYALVVILFVLLLAGGLGSWFARRYAPERIYAALGWIIPVVVVLMVFAALVLPAVVGFALPLSLPLRILVAGALVFPFGFFMGMPFPLGLRSQAQQATGTPVSVLWGINGVASVIGSIGGVVVAVAAGFTWVFIVGAVFYVLAWATRPR
ncbi:MAG: spermidine synthase [Planctomycetota bacterium]|jgi:hypothetical protein